AAHRLLPGALHTQGIGQQLARRRRLRRPLGERAGLGAACRRRLQEARALPAPPSAMTGRPAGIATHAPRLRLGVSLRHALDTEASQTRDASTRMVPVMATRKAATPWGPADLVEELTVSQQAGRKRFASVVQLLETNSGE